MCCLSFIARQHSPAMQSAILMQQFYPSLTLCHLLVLVAFSALTLLVGWREGHPTCKKWGMVKVGTCYLDGVAPSRMVGVFASVNLPLYHEVQKFSSGTSSPGWSWKKAIKRFCWWYCIKMTKPIIRQSRMHNSLGTSFLMLNVLGKLQLDHPI